MCVERLSPYFTVNVLLLSAVPSGHFAIPVPLTSVMVTSAKTGVATNVVSAVMVYVSGSATVVLVPLMVHVTEGVLPYF